MPICPEPGEASQDLLGKRLSHKLETGEISGTVGAHLRESAYGPSFAHTYYTKNEMTSRSVEYSISLAHPVQYFLDPHPYKRFLAIRQDLKRNPWMTLLY